VSLKKKGEFYRKLMDGMIQNQKPDIQEESFNSIRKLGF
jgi:hypothetical protein